MSLMKKATTNNRGFTIIELIVSIAIIAILLIAGAGILSTSLVTIAKEGNDTELLYQAQDAMEKLTAGQISNLNSYSELLLEVRENVTMSVKESADPNRSFDVEGIYYIIKEKSTDKIILKSFVPN